MKSPLIVIIKLNALYYILPIIVFTNASFAQEKDPITLITDNVTWVCDKPQDAGTHWDIRVRGDGNAGLKLKFLNVPDIGVSAEAEFTKQEWTGIKNTVENSADYRDCVKTLVPLFLDKFQSDVNSALNESSKPLKSLGGIKWIDFKGGVGVTLSECNQTGEMVSCSFLATASDSDVQLNINGESAVYDQIGRKYNTSFAKVANFSKELKTNRHYIESELVHGVDTPMVLRFQGVNNGVSSISKVTLHTRIYSAAGSNDHIFDFRNVDILLE